jgi:hypothetical protein
MRRGFVIIGSLLAAASLPGWTGPTVAAAVVDHPIAVLTTSVNFGVVAVGGEGARQVFVRNEGAAPFGPMNMTGGAPFPVGGMQVFGGSQNCQGATLAPGATCYVRYTFGPTTPGAFESSSRFTLALASDSTNYEEFEVALRGKTSADQPLAALDPARLLDTRPGGSTVDDVSEGIGQRAAGSITELVVAGRGGVPPNAIAAFLNVTAVGPTGPGHLILFPCGTQQPTASNVNYQAGDVVPNAVLAKIGTGGKVCIYTHAAAHVVVDVNGYAPPGGSPSPASPVRLLDTRPGGETIDGIGAGIGRVPAGSVTEVLITSRGGVPNGSTSVFLNLTAVRPLGSGHLIVFPCGAEPPTASNVNYVAGDVVANAVFAKIGTGGKVCIYSHAATHLVVDLNGFVPLVSPASVPPARLLDTRSGGETVDDTLAGIGQRSAGSITEIRVTGRGGVPANATAAIVNVTAVRPTGKGHLILFPCGNTPPTASIVNYQAGDVVPNAAVAKIGLAGEICVYTHAATHLVVDVNGYVT